MSTPSTSVRASTTRSSPSSTRPTGRRWVRPSRRRTTSPSIRTETSSPSTRRVRRACRPAKRLARPTTARLHFSGRRLRSPSELTASISRSSTRVITTTTRRSFSTPSSSGRRLPEAARPEQPCSPRRRPRTARHHRPAASNGYTITISNPSGTAVSLSSIFDVLPAGFSYTAGSTTGATTSNPSISAQTLTWNGPFNVPAGGNVALHFNVTVSMTPGDYFNDAGGSASGGSVSPTGPTAKITVTAEPPPASADLAITKTDSSDPVSVGQELTLHDRGAQQRAGCGSERDRVRHAPRNGFVRLGEREPGHLLGTTVVSCNLGTVASGADATVTIKVTPTTDADLSNTASIDSTTTDPTSGNDSDTETTTVNAVSPPTGSTCGRIQGNGVPRENSKRSSRSACATRQALSLRRAVSRSTTRPRR